MRNFIIEAAVDRPHATLAVMALLLLAGVGSRIAIPIESEPNIDVPYFMVSVAHEGISPEDAARLLLKPLESELRIIGGVDEVRALAYEGSVRVLVEFDASHDLEEALADVREAVDRAKPNFPVTADEPVVLEQSASDFPIIQVNLVGGSEGGVSERVVFNLAQDLKDAIEALPTILEAEMQGHREELLEVVINPAVLESYQVSTEQLITTVIRNNRLIPAGSLDTGSGRVAVKVPGLIKTAEDLRELPVKADGDSVVTLRDVATIRRTFKDRQRYARVNGRQAISLNVYRRQNANVVDTVDAVKEVVEAFRPKLPARLDLIYTQDQAPFARSQVTELQGNIITTLMLVMVLVVAAIGVRSGIIVGTAIPASFLFALLCLWALGFTFNFMVMFGMLLGLGMLIDGAIVVVEFADRKMAEGMAPRDAYVSAAKRMFWPVSASIGTTLAAFLPLLFWPGLSGKFMSFLPVTVFFVLAGSLAYALLFGPTIGALAGHARTRDDRARRVLVQLEDGDPRTLPGFTGAYARLLGAVCRHAGLTLVIVAVVLAGVYFAYSQFSRGMVFFSDGDPVRARIAVRARGNLAAAEAYELVREAEAPILGIPGIKDVVLQTQVGGGGAGSPGLADANDTIGRMYVQMHHESERSMSGREILERAREATGDLAGVTVEVREAERGPPVGKPIQIQFSAEEKALLDPVVAAVRAHMDTEMTGLRDIDDTRPLPGIEWQLAVDRAQAAFYNADVSLVGIAVRLVTNGVKVGEYRPDTADEVVDIRLRYPSAARGVSALDDLKITTPNGRVPISNFVKRTAVPNVDVIERIDGKVVEFIRADVDPGVLAGRKVAELQAWLDQADLDPKVGITFRGADEEQTRSFDFMLVALSAALLLMFVLLVIQFNNTYQSVLILAAVAMSTGGVLLGLLITNSTFSAILTGVGVVALAGIVVNNNIVLIDTFNHLRREHPELDYVSLIVRTGAQRLRPVLLTTATTIMGLLPLASHFSIDFINRSIVYGGLLSSFWVPLAQAIVSGLTFATLLTLIATPALLAMPYRASIRNLAALTERAKTNISRAWANTRQRWRRVDSGAAVPLVVSAERSQRGKKEPRR
ncbi:MAG: efflux RND transporter permease subunit [Pseudomonadales bacterium]|nr:efflux RND transporter permease subunit [Pseudomonadales bacterium]